MNKLMKRLITIAIVVLLVKAFYNYVHPETTDISYLASMNKTEIERTLGCWFTDNPDMVRKIYAYTSGEVTVDSNSKLDIDIVYIDGELVGIHTDNKVYSMFGVCIGDSILGVEDSITLDYDRDFEVLNDMYQGSSTATFFYNYESKECLVVVVNDLTSRVVALTYYPNGQRAVERLSGL